MFEVVLTSGKFDGKGAVSCAQDAPGTKLQSYPQLSHNLCTVLRALTSHFEKICGIDRALSNLIRERIEPWSAQEKSEYFRSRTALWKKKMRLRDPLSLQKLKAVS